MSNRYKNAILKMRELAKGRQLILWGVDELSLYIYEDICELGFDIKYFISDEEAGKEINGKEVKTSIELFYENKADIYIMVFVLVGHANIYQKLVDMGFEESVDFHIGNISGYFAPLDAIDSFLAYNRYYGDVLGFKVLGEGSNKKDSYHILALGGSTTDPTVGNNKSWVDFLYERLSKVHPQIVVINGGMAGYTANQEFLKFCRDGLELKPDMLITFDGVNDVNLHLSCKNYPYLHHHLKRVYDYIEKKGDFAPDMLGLRNVSKMVHGLKQNKQGHEYWIDAQRRIHAVAEEFGIAHVGFLQPMLMTGKTIIGDKQKELLMAACRVMPPFGELFQGMKAFYEGVTPFIKEKDYMHDLTAIFDNKEHMYYDHCHSTEEGNKVIADAIYGKIKDLIVEG